MLPAATHACRISTTNVESSRVDAEPHRTRTRSIARALESPQGNPDPGMCRRRHITNHIPLLNPFLRGMGLIRVPRTRTPHLLMTRDTRTPAGSTYTYIIIMNSVFDNRTFVISGGESLLAVVRWEAGDLMGARELLKCIVLSYVHTYAAASRHCSAKTSSLHSWSGCCVCVKHSLVKHML